MVYGLFWPPTFFWLFTGCCLFRSARTPDGVLVGDASKRRNFSTLHSVAIFRRWKRRLLRCLRKIVSLPQIQKQKKYDKLFENFDGDVSVRDV